MSLRDLLEPDCGGSNPLLSMSARMASATPEARVRVLDQSGVSSEGAERSATIPPLFSNLIEIENNLQRSLNNNISKITAKREEEEDRNVCLPSAERPLSSSSSLSLPLSARAATFRADSLISQLREAQEAASCQESWTESGRAGGQRRESSWVEDFQTFAPSPLAAGVTEEASKLASTGAVTKRPPAAAAAAPFHGMGHLMAPGPMGRLLPPLETSSSSGARWAEEYLPKELSELPLVADEEEKAVCSLAEQIFGPSAESSAAERWAEEFADLTDADVEKAAATAAATATATARATYKEDFWKSLEKDWEDLSSAGENEAPSWLSFDDDGGGYDDVADGLPSSYDFRRDNPAMRHPSPLEEGKKRLQEGDIPGAVLLFEAACQQDDQSSEAWSLLGSTQAQNEQDPRAIAALRRALSLLGPASERAPALLLTLAASYANESHNVLACTTLQDWIYNHCEYSAHLPARPAASPTRKPHLTTTFLSPEMHTETTELFLTAARVNSGPTPDADVQCGLGILFNLSEEYDKAVDCFRAAVSARPDDALLWNRLGASLANGDRSEEAVSAYRRALEESPGLVRSRYNLGISCINLKAYTEGCQHFLRALSFQSAAARDNNGQGGNGGGAVSESIWSSLRLGLSLMERRDLLPVAEARDIAAIAAELGLNLEE